MTESFKVFLGSFIRVTTVMLLLIEDLFFPGAALALLILAVGFFLVADGLVAVLLAISPFYYSQKKFNLTEGFALLGSGAYILLGPGVNSLSFLSFAIANY